MPSSFIASACDEDMSDHVTHSLMSLSVHLIDSKWIVLGECCFSPTLIHECCESWRGHVLSRALEHLPRNGESGLDLSELTVGAVPIVVVVYEWEVREGGER